MKNFNSIYKKLGILACIVFISLITLCIGIIILTSDPMDSCIDVAYCKEGLQLNINNKKITVNKQTCVENNGYWYDDRKICQFMQN